MIDTVIVGAGPSGLCAAKTILQCDPTSEIVIFDAQGTIGGVWAEEKIYPLLKTNNHFGGLDFSDFPMQEGNGAAQGKHIPGAVVHDFLCDYARRWNLEEKIVFNTTVREVSRPEDGPGWRLTIESSGQQETRHCRKLIVAIGINNAPHLPHHKGQEAFGAPILHSSQLGLESGKLFGDESVKTVAVLGGGKSAYDAVYLAATNGRKVDWIIRKSGRGPVWVFPLITKLGPFEAQRENLSVRRLVSFFSPCIWDDGFSWIRSWIHGTAVGRFIVQKFWTQLHLDTLRDCRYRTHESLKALEPGTSPFWYGTTAGAYSYEPGLLEFITSGQVRVHREDISHLSDRQIHLANDVSLDVDGFIMATGFSAKPTITFNPPSLHSDLGIPSTHLTDAQQEFWRQWDTRSDQAILAAHPTLRQGPIQDPKSSQAIPDHPGGDAEFTHSPFRLYRCIAPPGLTASGDRSLAFIGIFSNFANHTRLELQCLWTYAYLNHKLDIDPKTVFEEASLASRYSRHRSPFGHGRHLPDHVFDQLPYFDVLVRDLGSNPWRKHSMLQEIFSPYTVGDYKGLVSEWIEKKQKR